MIGSLAATLLFRELHAKRPTILYRWALWYLGRGYMRAPHKFTWDIEFKREDAWIGVYWRTKEHAGFTRQEAWICLLPCLPLHIERCVRYRRSKKT